MKSIKLLTNDNLDNLVDKFNLKSAKTYQSESNSNFIVLFAEEKNNACLEKNWDEINNIISEYLEEFISNNFTRWNIYIIYLLSDKVTKELKYKIENDTFFARKIVEDGYKFQSTDENNAKLISKHIDFTDLIINSEQPKKELYESTSEIYLKLKDADTISETQIDEMLKLLEGTTDEI